MHSHFGLILMVNHACNLRCAYCYTGAKFNRRMSESIGRKALDRAVASIHPGGTLELGFFGGEPLVEAEMISRMIEHAHMRITEADVTLSTSLTTNGTLFHPSAWAVMTLTDLDLVISCDGLPEVHDRHRLFPDGRGSSGIVLNVMEKLSDAGKTFRVNMVVRPDNVEELSEGIEFLHSVGVRRVDLSLDLWTNWTREDAVCLKETISRCAEFWRDHLPDFGINWFDEKLLLLSGMQHGETARCGFGNGEIAVAPSGNLYPCERLIGEDRGDNPMRLSGHALDGVDFLECPTAASRSDRACDACAIQSICGTTCRCSNYVRTGQVTQPDRLLCLLNELCFREMRQFLDPSHATPEREEQMACR